MAVLKVEKIMGSGNLGEKIPLGAPETFFLSGATGGHGTKGSQKTIPHLENDQIIRRGPSDNTVVANQVSLWLFSVAGCWALIGQEPGFPPNTVRQCHSVAKCVPPFACDFQVTIATLEESMIMHDKMFCFSLMSSSSVYDVRVAMINLN